MPYSIANTDICDCEQKLSRYVQRKFPGHFHCTALHYVMDKPMSMVIQGGEKETVKKKNGTKTWQHQTTHTNHTNDDEIYTHTHKQRWFQPNKTSSSASNKKKRERKFLIVVGTHQVHTTEETVRIKGLIESKERNTIHTKKTRPTKTCWVIWHFWQHFYYVMMFNSFTTRSFRFVSVSFEFQ